MYTPEPKVIEAFKQKHGRVFLAKSEDGKYSCLLKYPSRKDISYATANGVTDPMKMSETLINTLWLAGDEEMRKEDGYFRGLTATMDQLIDVQKVELEEL